MQRIGQLSRPAFEFLSFNIPFELLDITLNKVIGDHGSMAVHSKLCAAAFTVPTRKKVWETLVYGNIIRV